MLCDPVCCAQPPWARALAPTAWPSAPLCSRTKAGAPPRLALIPFRAGPPCWGVCLGAEVKHGREVASGTSPSLDGVRPGQEGRGAGGPAHLQVLQVGRGLAVGELCPRVAGVELMADAADIAHHRHHEVRTCGTAGSVHSHSSTPARCAALFRGPFRTRASAPWPGCCAGIWGVTWRLRSYHVPCWGYGSLGLSAPLWLALWTSPGNMQVWASDLTTPRAPHS